MKILRLSPLCSLLFAFLLLPACTGPRPLKGGRAVTTGPISQAIQQSQNPSQPAKQDQQTLKVRTFTLPPGSRIEQLTGPTSSFILHPSSFLTVTEREETQARTELGAAQKDTARELGAKLSSLKGIVWVGLLLFIFGIASFAWPPLKAIVGSVTTSLILTLGGLALMILPTVIVGNELLILGGVALAVVGWFIAHRHGQLRGLLDANKNGIDDRQEQPIAPPTH
jgi:hypothetical protein